MWPDGKTRARCSAETDGVNQQDYSVALLLESRERETCLKHESIFAAHEFRESSTPLPW